MKHPVYASAVGPATTGTTTTNALSNADTLAGIAMPVRASVSNGINVLMNVEALAGFVPKGPQGLLEGSS